MNIAFLYEHPTWSKGLIAAFARRNIDLTCINIAEFSFDASGSASEFDAVINRVNIMPSADRNPKVAFQTLHYLNWLELKGVRVINGSKAHTIGSSKALQNGVFSSLGLHHPRGVAIYSGSDALHAAKQIGYPVIVKPNIGGSGSGIARYENIVELESALANRSLELGIDGSGIVQRYVHSDGFVYRVEILGDALFYSIRQPIQEGTFNYCAADGCSTLEDTMDVSNDSAEPAEFDFCAVSGGQAIETFQPPPAVLAAITRIIKACAADVGGVEYFIDVDTGDACYYDFNPYSNFVSNGESLLGFSPEDLYIDFVMDAIAR